VTEADGTLGTVCIYEATGPEALHEHARRAGIAIHEVFPVAETVVVRPDPTR